ncbi:unnamed protein product, partial [Adineta ricciae]
VHCHHHRISALQHRPVSTIDLRRTPMIVHRRTPMIDHHRIFKKCFNRRLHETISTSSF